MQNVIFKITQNSFEQKWVKIVFWMGRNYPKEV
jgi:hypothetical protein